MLLVLGCLHLAILAGMCTDNFAVALAVRVLLLFASGVLFAGVFRCRCFRAGKRPVKSCCQVIVGVSAGMVLGVPISSFVAANFSLDAAMAVFAAGNLLAFAATLVFVPRLPVEGALPAKNSWCC